MNDNNDNIIHVNFKRKEQPEKQVTASDITVDKSDMIMGYKPKTRWGFLLQCKDVLVKEDYETILCSIVDNDYYEKCEDKQIKDLIDIYFNEFKM